MTISSRRPGELEARERLEDEIARQNKHTPFPEPEQRPFKILARLEAQRPKGQGLNPKDIAKHLGYGVRETRWYIDQMSAYGWIKTEEDRYSVTRMGSLVLQSVKNKLN